MADSTAGPSDFVKPQSVLYCTVCRLPCSYCEFGPKASKCKTALEKSHPDVYAQLYSDAALEANMQALTVKQRENLDKDAAKREKQSEAREARAAQQLKEAKVIIKRIERTKRKHITSVQGLELFDIDLKKAAKLFANRFATGASVSKSSTNPNEEEIVIQGDVADEVEELLQDKSSKVAAVLGGGKIPEDNVDVLEVKHKKGDD